MQLNRLFVEVKDIYFVKRMTKIYSFKIYSLKFIHYCFAYL